MSEFPSELLIFVGLYEEDLVAYRVITDRQDPDRFQLDFLMMEHIQRGSIRALASHGSLLASGGADGRVVVIDLKESKSWDVVMPQEETVNDLEFSHCGNYLFVGCHEMNLHYVGVREQNVICHKLNIHKRPIVSVKVRPPLGRQLVTVGQDRVIRISDLYGGLTINLNLWKAEEEFEGPILCTVFSPSGNLLATAGLGFAKVVLLDDRTEIRSVKYIGKPMAVLWLSETVLAIGMYTGYVATIRIGDKQPPEWSRLHSNGNLKAMARVGMYMASVSNESELILWDIVDERRFWPRCQTIIAGRATTIIMMEVTEPCLRKFITEMLKSRKEAAKDAEMYDFNPSDDEPMEQESVPECATQVPPDNELKNTPPKSEDEVPVEDEKVLPGDLENQTASEPPSLVPSIDDWMNNTFGDSQPEEFPDNDSVVFVGEEQLEPESDDEVPLEEEDEDLQGEPDVDHVIPETPSKDSLIDLPTIRSAPSMTSSTSMESLRVSSEEQFKSCADRPPMLSKESQIDLPTNRSAPSMTSSTSMESLRVSSDEQFKLCANRPPTPGPPLNPSVDDEDDDDDDDGGCANPPVKMTNLERCIAYFYKGMQGYSPTPISIGENDSNQEPVQQGGDDVEQGQGQEQDEPESSAIEEQNPPVVESAVVVGESAEESTTAVGEDVVPENKFWV